MLVMSGSGPTSSILKLKKFCFEEENEKGERNLSEVVDALLRAVPNRSQLAVVRSWRSLHHAGPHFTSCLQLC